MDYAGEGKPTGEFWRVFDADLAWHVLPRFGPFRRLVQKSALWIRASMNLSRFPIGRYFLIAIAALAAGKSLPAADAPATPSFSATAGDLIRDKDFGVVKQGAAGSTFNFAVFNVPAVSGTTSPMSLSSTGSFGNTSSISLATGTISGLAPGAQSPLQLILTTAQAGRLSVSYTLDFGSDSLGNAYAGRLAIGGHAIVSPQGDYDSDGDVDNADYAIWRANFATTNTAADGNVNGIVDAGDYVVWRKKYTGPMGSGSSTLEALSLETPNSIPEPSAALLLFLGTVAFAGYRRRRGDYCHSRADRN
jgi:hypothetical protein